MYHTYRRHWLLSACTYTLWQQEILASSPGPPYEREGPVIHRLHMRQSIHCKIIRILLQTHGKILCKVAKRSSIRCPLKHHENQLSLQPFESSIVRRPNDRA